MDPEYLENFRDTSHHFSMDRARLRELADEHREIIDGIRRDATASLGFWYYTPLKHYQEQWFRASEAIKLILAGNQVGKTTALVVEALREATGESPIALGGTKREFRRNYLKGKRILLGGETYDSIDANLWPVLQNMLSPDMLESDIDLDSPQAPRRPIIFGTGCTLVLASYAQDSKALEGAQYDWLGFDEPPKQAHFTSLMRGTMKREGAIWVTATPLEGAGWLRDVLIDPSNDPTDDLFGKVAHFKVDMHMNCRECHGGFLPHDRIKMFLATLREDQHEYHARAHGEFYEHQGIEYSYVKRETHVVEDHPVPTDAPIVEVIDPSSKKGIYAIWAYVDPNDYWTIFHAAHIRDGGMDFLCEQIKGHRERFLPAPPVEAICDQRFGPHMASKIEQTTWFQEFSRRGLHYTPSSDGLHETLHDWFKVEKNIAGDTLRPKLVMTKSVADQKEGLLWATEKFKFNPEMSYREKYKQKGKDWIDCVRYLAGHPGLTAQRLSRRGGKGHPARRPLNLTYAKPSRPETPAAMFRAQAKMVLRPRRRRLLRRQGWNL